MNKVIYFIIIVILTGCAMSKNARSKMDSWLGSTENDLVMTWGAPTITNSDGAGGKILTYSRRIFAQLNYGQNLDYYDCTDFYINSNNSVYNWRKYKNPNPPVQVDLRLRTY